MVRKTTCNDCGNEKEPNYLNDACCAKCRSIRNKARRVQAMIDKGKRPYGSGRSPLCSLCGEPKEETHLTSGYCRKCNLSRISANLAHERELKGLKPYGSGRKDECSRCGGIKENVEVGYCFECKRITERERRLKYKEAPEFVIKEREKINTRYKDDIDFRLKKLVRSSTNRYIRLGLLIKQPCEICGAEKVDAHHDDYSKPLDVRWLCRFHHAEHHKNEKK